MKSKLALAIASLVCVSQVGAQIPPPASEPRDSKMPAGQQASKSNANTKQVAMVAPAAPPRLPPLPAIPGMATEEFDAVRQDTAPLSPEQIRGLRRMLEDVERASSDAIKSPKSVSTSLPVNLSPGATAPVIRVSPRHVTSIVFMDSTGAPWPIIGFSVGDQPRFDVKREGPPHTLTAKGAYFYGETNVAVFLSGLSTPVNIGLLSGQREVDTRVDLSVPGRGPGALPTAPSSRTGERDEHLLSFLDGVPPGAAKPLKVSGGVATAWSYKGQMYLRTRLVILSPSWNDSISSSDGTSVYAMPDTPVVLASIEGRVINLRLTEPQ